MKRKKSIFKLLAIILLLGVITTGCFKRDDMEDINIITTETAISIPVKPFSLRKFIIFSFYKI